MTDAKVHTSLFVVGLALSVVGLAMFSMGGFHWALTYGLQGVGLVVLVVAAFGVLGS